jgi:hypothetical protein
MTEHFLTDVAIVAHGRSAKYQWSGAVVLFTPQSGFLAGFPDDPCQGNAKA